MPYMSTTTWFPEVTCAWCRGKLFLFFPGHITWPEMMYCLVSLYSALCFKTHSWERGRDRENGMDILMPIYLHHSQKNSIVTPLHHISVKWNWRDQTLEGERGSAVEGKTQRGKPATLSIVLRWESPSSHSVAVAEGRVWCVAPKLPHDLGRFQCCLLFISLYTVCPPCTPAEVGEEMTFICLGLFV